MDDFRLKVFITAARTLSFTRTAERLFISQPAVSKHIGELESQYKVQLFMRRGSRLELTGAGETLLACAERLADDYRRMQYEMSLCADAPVGELRLGASTTIAQYLLPPILARFTTRFPGVRVAMMSGNSDQVEQALGGHGIDLGMVESLSRRQWLHYTACAPDELAPVARTCGPYSRTESITADELREIPLVLREGGSGTLEVIKAALGRAGIRIPQLNVVMRLGSTEGIKAFVRNSDAMAIVSVISVVDELRSGVLRGGRLVVTDPSRVLLTPDTLDKLRTRQVRLEAAEAARTLCVTINPVSAYGWKFDKDEFMARMKEAVDVPVINVKEELA